MKSIMASKKLCILLATIILLVAISACSGGEQGTADTSNGRTNEPVEQPNVNNEVEEPTKEEKMSAEITQMALQAWKSSIDTIWAHGAIEITNTGDVPIEIGDISISFVGDDNSILGTVSMILAIPEILLPGETAYAGDSTIIEGIDDPSEIVDMETSIDFDETDEQPQLLDVQDLKIIPSDFGGAKVTGRVVNISQENADDIRIIIALFDENDKLLGIYEELPDVTLAPGKKMGFETSYPGIEVEGFVDKVKKMVGKAYNWSWDF
ncbi:MAG: hypothetical protein GX024_11570 [Clostridiales bacterium]|nr:hypothetical protein [Clostridiales bacterium]